MADETHSHHWPSAIGDIVMASPMIRVLRNAWPRGHIAWLADTSVRGLLDDHPALDEVIYWSKEDWRQMMKTFRLLRLSAEVASFSRDLRKRRFDIAIDGQGLLRSRLLAWLSGAGEHVSSSCRTRFFSDDPDCFPWTGQKRHELRIHFFDADNGACTRPIRT